MAVTHVSGLVTSTVYLTANTTLTSTAHAGRTIALNAAAGVTATLPAATGTGDTYRFLVAAAVTSNNDIVKVANASDYMRGFVVGATDTAGTAMAFVTANSGVVATESDTITLNGTTTGGRIGDLIEAVDIAANVWAVRCYTAGSGVEATPFSAAV